MKSPIVKIVQFILPMALILSACTQLNVEGNISGLSLLNRLIGNSGDVSEKPADLPSYLSEQDIRLAADQSYMTMITNTDLNPNTFNLESWPKTCTAAADSGHKSINDCTDGNNDQKIGLRDITLSGQVFILDANQFPWFAMNNQRNIRSLRIEADKVVIRNALNLPSSNLEIQADELIFEENGVINTTPNDMKEVRPSYKENEPRGFDGIDGLPGSYIKVIAQNIQVIGDRENPRLIANGGAGQWAGEGSGTRIGEPRSSLPGRATFFPDGFMDPERKLENGRGGIIQYEINLDYLSFHVMAGDKTWPTNGRDAKAGGYPGAGGPGGVIQIYSEKNELYSASTDVGTNGQGEVMRFGTLPQGPNPSYIYYCDRNQNTLYSHTQYNGKDEASPQLPKKQNAVGEIKLNTISNYLTSSYWTNRYFQQKLKFIKELYFSRKFKETIEAINNIENKLEKLSSSQNSNDFDIAVTVEFSKLKQLIEAQKDYFGRGLADAPHFAFDFNLAEFQNQVQKAMRIYYLARLFKVEFKTREDRLTVAREALTTLEGSLSDTRNKFAQSSSALSSLRTNIEIVRQSQTSVENDLKLIEENIKKQAEQNIINEHKAGELLKIVDVAASICQVIPIYQPALAAGATLLKTAIKGPKTKDLNGWADYYKNIKNGYDGFKNQGMLDESSKSWQNFAEQFDANKLVGMTLQQKAEYIRNLQSQISKLSNNISDAINPITQPSYPKNEIEIEIAKLKAADPIFFEFSKKMTALVEEKTKIQTDLIMYTDLITQMINQYSAYVAISSKISSTVLLDSNWADDGVLSMTFQKLADQSEERLIYLFDETIRSYNYLTLEEYKQPLSVVHLRQKMDSLISTNKSNDESITILSNFYLSQVDQLTSALSLKLRDGNPLVTVHNASGVIHLTHDQITELNSTGNVEIVLDEDFYFGRQNTRIRNIEATQYNFTKEIGPDSSYPGIILRFDLAKEGALILNNQRYSYNYPSIGNLFLWENTFAFDGNTVDFQKNEISSSFKGLISSLVNNPTAIQYSPIFSLHAGLTKMNITISRKQGSFRFVDLALKVNYIYSVVP